MHPDFPGRFAQKISVIQSGCWIWTGATSNRGYGHIWVAGKTKGAHRVAYEIVKGPIPAGLTIDHLCRVKACVNPDHLEPTTLRVNLLRGIGPTAVNAAKTHCIRGHPLAEGHIYLRWRVCRKCRRIRNRVWSQKNRESIASYHCAYRKKNHKAVTESKRIHYAKNREAILQRRRQKAQSLRPGLKQSEL